MEEMKHSRLIISAVIIIALFASVFVVATIAQEVAVTARLVGAANSIKNGDPFYVDIMLDTGAGNRISGTTAVLSYPSNALIFDKEASLAPSDTCRAAGYKLNQLLSTKDDPKEGKIALTRVLIDRDENLPSGSFCFGTVAFKAKMSGFWSFLPWVKRTGTVRLDNLNDWETVGPGNAYAVLEDSSSSGIDITVTH